MSQSLAFRTGDSRRLRGPNPRRTSSRSRQQQRLRFREIEVQEEERRRLARDLHDEAGHRLTAAILKLDAVMQRHGQDVELRESLEAARVLIRECADGLHEVAFNLRPCILADLGLYPAVRSLARRAQEAASLPVSVQLDGVPRRVPEEVELTAFRIVQEALTNALKYAQASIVTITIAFTGEALVIEISDDGVGFDLAYTGAARPRLGLTGMRERAALVGGSVRLRTEPGRGTTVWARLPLEEAA
jgi:two-component system sensor histidine kinase NreB